MSEDSKKTAPGKDAREEKKDNAAEQGGSQGSAEKKGLRRLFNVKVVIALVAVTLLVNVAFLAFCSLGSDKTVDKTEHDLGTYDFSADPSEKGNISSAEFNLHISVLEGLEKETRRRLDAKKFRVQQDIEELLRRAHGGDFDDPNLGELKRRLQARINETLGMKAIADVIITDLKLARNPQAAEPTDKISQTPPWAESSTN